MESPLRHLGLLAALIGSGLGALAGCGRPSRSNAPASLVARSADEVVATVDGRPIYADAIALQAEARGVDARQALSDLIDAEVLTSAAVAAGLDTSPEVQHETKAALVRRYLAETFEKEVTSKDVPQGAVSRLYDKNRRYLDHTTYVDVWHLLVSFPHRPPSADERLQARARAEALLASAKKVESLDAFKALASPGPLVLEEVITAEDGWTEAAFSRAAFAQLKRPGDVSDLVETSYGFHVLYLVRYIPAEHVPLAEVEGKLRDALFPDMQKQAFVHLLDVLTSRHRIEKFPEHLPK